jgi:hypothetical protein
MIWKIEDYKIMKINFIPLLSQSSKYLIFKFVIPITFQHSNLELLTLLSFPPSRNTSENGRTIPLSRQYGCDKVNVSGVLPLWGVL